MARTDQLETDHNLVHEDPIIIIIHNYLCIYLRIFLFDLIFSELSITCLFFLSCHDE